MNFVYFHLSFIILINLISQTISEQWIDVSDMTDPRILRNRHRHSSIDEPTAFHRKVKKEVKYGDHNSFEDLSDSVLDYVPKNPFPKVDSCLDKSLQLEDTNKLEDSRLECISNKLKVNTELSRTDDQCNVNEGKTKILLKCISKNKELTEDLVCFRNLKSLYKRYFSKISDLIHRMQNNNQKIEIHPYSPEFHILIKSLEHENCLSVIDDLEKLISRLDRFVYRIEPADYSKEILYGTISAAILFCFYYVYRYLRISYLLFTLLFFIIYAHEYFYLLKEKKAEISHQFKKLNDCQNVGFFTGVFNFFFGGFFASVSFKGNECDLNEDLLYIDAVFTINPLTPVFTIIPKLFTKTIIILFENSAIAFRKFSSQLPIFHAYPILIIFLSLIVIIIYLLTDWNVRLRRVDQEYRIRLASLPNANERLRVDSNRFSLNLPSAGQNCKLTFKLNKSITNGELNRRRRLNNENSNSTNSLITEQFSNESSSTKLTRSKSLDFIPCI